MKKLAGLLVVFCLMSFSVWGAGNVPEQVTHDKVTFFNQTNGRLIIGLMHDDGKERNFFSYADFQHGFVVVLPDIGKATILAECVEELKKEGNAFTVTFDEESYNVCLESKTTGEKAFFSVVLLSESSDEEDGSGQEYDDEESGDE
ncbi:hypothetical protein K2X40_01370 [Candidatus Babeliales bacterium]|nr:hypothetical protein [Candidatus Babeliales bacterium]